jgi:intracellular septation protein A
MTLTYWTYRRPFNVSGQAFEALIGAGLTDWQTRLLQGERELARDGTHFIGGQADYRNHRVCHILPEGALLEVESGWVSWFSVGIAVRINGVLVHESHPGKRLAWPMLPGQGPMTPETLLQVQQQQQRDREQWVRNKPSLMVDIALGLLFFIVSKATGNLTTAALVGAAAGLAVVILQRFVKADLLGGLALFGVFTLLLSAGFSLYFQDERMVQLKGSILGTTIALVILGDALFNRGRYFGARMARYVMGAALNPQRLALGLALLGLCMASLNLLATQLLSKDAWLIYTTFVDTPLAMVLVLGVFRFARQ